MSKSDQLKTSQVEVEPGVLWTIELRRGDEVTIIDQHGVTRHHSRSHVITASQLALMIHRWKPEDDYGAFPAALLRAAKKTELDPVETRCPHGEDPAECDDCLRASDRAFDEDRETRFFGKGRR